MTTRLKWGILSTARINRRLIPPMKQATRSEVVAVASRSAAKAHDFAQKWDISQTFDSYEAMLTSPDINVVYIPLPNSMHYEWTLKAAEAGKHILCEKPIALTTAQIDEMITAAEANGVILQEQFQYHRHPQLLKLKRVINEGLIGEVTLLRTSFTVPLKADTVNIRFRKAMGGGSLWDVGSYTTSFLLSVTDADPIAVTGWQKNNEDGADTIFAGQIHFDKGIIAQFDCGFHIPFRVGTEVVGTNGVLQVDNPWQPDVDGRTSGLRHIAKDDSVTLIATEVIDPYLCSIQAMEAAVLDGTPSVFSLAQSRQNVVVIEALYQAAETGQVVAVGR